MDSKEVIDECRKRDENKDVVVLYPCTNGYGVWEWKEFHAFIDRLGVPKDPRITRLTMTIATGEPVRLIMHFQGSDTTGHGVVVEHKLN